MRWLRSVNLESGGDQPNLPHWANPGLFYVMVKDAPGEQPSQTLMPLTYLIDANAALLPP